MPKKSLNIIFATRGKKITVNFTIFALCAEFTHHDA